jgi:hypothetical protein
MIQTRQIQPLGEAIRWAPLGPGGDPQMSLQGLGAGPQYRAGYGLGAGAMSYGYGDYGNTVSLSGRRSLGEVIRWAPLGPGGDPRMSLQGRRRYGLRGFPTAIAEVDWAQVGLGAVIGIGAFLIAKKQRWIK